MSEVLTETELKPKKYSDSNGKCSQNPKNGIRSYKLWLKYCKEKNIVIRHDIDFDIKTAWRMLELERRFGLNSVVYVDIHSPSYSMDDIKELYNEYRGDGFSFGLHINVAYDYKTPDEAWEQYLEDIKTMRKEGIYPHSVVGHFYDARIVPVPPYSNRDIETNSTYQKDLPMSFKTAYFHRIKPIPMSDSGGKLCGGYNLKSPMEYFDYIKKGMPAYILAHPVHYRATEEVWWRDQDAIYTKKLGGLPVNTQNIHIIQSQFRKRLTTYSQQWIENTGHLAKAQDIIMKIAVAKYRELITVVDAGCSIGLLGMYLTEPNNLKYIGADIEPEYIAVGKDMYNALGYAPHLIVKDIFEGKHIPGDIFVFLAAEDLPIKYPKLYELCLNYKDVILTTVTKERYGESKKRGKKYWYISERKFKEIFMVGFNLKIRATVYGRYLYWLERKTT